MDKNEENASGQNNRISLAVNNGEDLNGDVDEDLLAELDALDGGDNEEEDDGYERSVTLFFPYEIAVLFGVGYISVPIRDFLTWVAKEKEEFLLRIRDEYYGGDQEWDHYYQIEPPNFYASTEDRELLAFNRAQGRAARDAKRTEFEAEQEADSVRWEWIEAQFSDERAALETRCQENMLEYENLSSKWWQFFRQRDSWSSDRDERERAVREHLADVESRLKEESRKLSEIRFDINHRASKAWEALQNRANSIDPLKDAFEA